MCKYLLDYGPIYRREYEYMRRTRDARHKHHRQSRLRDKIQDAEKNGREE
jgi:hypothetical protein